MSNGRLDRNAYVVMHEPPKNENGSKMNGSASTNVKLTFADKPANGKMNGHRGNDDMNFQYDVRTNEDETSFEYVRKPSSNGAARDGSDDEGKKTSDSGFDLDGFLSEHGLDNWNDDDDDLDLDYTTPATSSRSSRTRNTEPVLVDDDDDFLAQFGLSDDTYKPASSSKSKQSLDDDDFGLGDLGLEEFGISTGSSSKLSSSSSSSSSPYDSFDYGDLGLEEYGIIGSSSSSKKASNENALSSPPRSSNRSLASQVKSPAPFVSPYRNLDSAIRSAYVKLSKIALLQGVFFSEAASMKYFKKVYNCLGPSSQAYLQGRVIFDGPDPPLSDNPELDEVVSFDYFQDTFRKGFADTQLRKVDDTALLPAVSQALQAFETGEITFTGAKSGALVPVQSSTTKSAPSQDSNGLSSAPPSSHAQPSNTASEKPPTPSSNGWLSESKSNGKAETALEKFERLMNFEPVVNLAQPASTVQGQLTSMLPPSQNGSRSNSRNGSPVKSTGPSAFGRPKTLGELSDEEEVPSDEEAETPGMRSASEMQFKEGNILFYRTSLNHYKEPIGGYSRYLPAHRQEGVQAEPSAMYIGRVGPAQGGQGFLYWMKEGREEEGLEQQMEKELSPANGWGDLKMRWQRGWLSRDTEGKIQGLNPENQCSLGEISCIYMGALTPHMKSMLIAKEREFGSGERDDFNDRSFVITLKGRPGYLSFEAQSPGSRDRFLKFLIKQCKNDGVIINTSCGPLPVSSSPQTQQGLGGPNGYQGGMYGGGTPHQMNGNGSYGMMNSNPMMHGGYGAMNGGMNGAMNGGMNGYNSSPYGGYPGQQGGYGMSNGGFGGYRNRPRTRSSVLRKRNTNPNKVRIHTTFANRRRNNNGPRSGNLRNMRADRGMPHDQSSDGYDGYQNGGYRNSRYGGNSQNNSGGTWGSNDMDNYDNGYNDDDRRRKKKKKKKKKRSKNEQVSMINDRVRRFSHNMRDSAVAYSHEIHPTEDEATEFPGDSDAGNMSSYGHPYGAPTPVQHGGAPVDEEADEDEEDALDPDVCIAKFERGFVVTNFFGLKNTEKMLMWYAPATKKMNKRRRKTHPGFNHPGRLYFAKHKPFAIPTDYKTKTLRKQKRSLDLLELASFHIGQDAHDNTDVFQSHPRARNTPLAQCLVIDGLDKSQTREWALATENEDDIIQAATALLHIMQRAGILADDSEEDDDDSDNNNNNDDVNGTNSNEQSRSPFDQPSNNNNRRGPFNSRSPVANSRNSSPNRSPWRAGQARNF